MPKEVIPWHSRISFRLFTLILAFTALPALLLGTTIYFAAQKALFNQIQKDLLFMLDQKTAEVNALLISMGLPNEQLKDVLIRAGRGEMRGDRAVERIAAEAIKKVDEFAQKYFQPLGMDGYAYIVDEKGVLVVHPVSPGKDISKESFVREMLGKRNGAISYRWQDEGESRPREKYAAYRTLNNGWILAVGTYTEELFKEMGLVAKTSGFALMLLIFGAGGLTLALARRITRPIEQLAEFMQEVAAGDLSREVAGASKDEIGMLARATDKARRGMLAMISLINHSARQLAASSQQLAALAATQEKEVLRVSSAAQQMAAGVQEAAAYLEELAGSGEEIRVAAAEINAQSESLSFGMAAIDAAAIQTSHTLKELHMRAGEIGKISELINGIAGQTSLLALNAAIEAARAKEHGRSFAVVAEEVQKLAERATSASREIAALIGHILLYQESARKQMETTLAEVARGQEALAALRAALQKIAVQIENVTGHLRETSQAVSQVAQGGQEVSAAATGLSQLAGENAAAA